MGAFTYDMEATSPLPAAKLFKAIILNDKLIPKLLPQAIKSVEILEGDGGPGTIKLITFGEGAEYKYAKHKVEGLDRENFIYTYSVIESDVFGDIFEKISYEVKFQPTPDGGSYCKNSAKYYTIGEFEPKQEEIKAGKEKSLAIFKAVEAYLLANPDA